MFTLSSRCYAHGELKMVSNREHENFLNTRQHQFAGFADNIFKGVFKATGTTPDKSRIV